MRDKTPGTILSSFFMLLLVSQNTHTISHVQKEGVLSAAAICNVMKNSCHKTRYYHSAGQSVCAAAKQAVVQMNEDGSSSRVLPRQPMTPSTLLQSGRRKPLYDGACGKNVKYRKQLLPFITLEKHRTGL